jgi:glycerol-3-phosphate acyltransferase PlsX
LIAVDANGADAGPRAVAEGARLSGERVLLFGPAGEIGDSGADVEVVDAPERIGGEEEPVWAVRSRPEASIVRAAAAVAEGRAQALVSAGATGPTLAAATLALKRIRGVHRPAIAALLPLPAGRVLLLDAGANVELRPEHLVQFAYMGAAFMEHVEGVRRPRVGLLSVGTEAGKGTPDVLAAYERLAAGSLDFAGNVEGFDIPNASVDVVVTDGFTGNVALKAMESASRVTREGIRAAVRSNPLSMLGGLLIRRRVDGLRAQLDPERVGGAILLGLRKPVVIGHGSFGPAGIASAVRLARRAVDERMVERTAAALRADGVLRSAPAGSVNDARGTRRGTDQDP